VRRAKLYYIRHKSAKESRLKEISKKPVKQKTAPIKKTNQKQKLKPKKTQPIK
ncbi:MAG: 50S ribosomal protein L19, partial [bacterium]